MPKINETMKKVTDNISPTVEESSPSQQDETCFGPGNPGCPHCFGTGYVHQDVPVNHPDFGRLIICSCLMDKTLEEEQNRRMQKSNLDAFKHMTFDAFNVQGRFGLGEQQINSLKSALNSAMHFAQEANGWLLLIGPYGCGKTHLAAAIANEAVQKNTQTLFLTVPDLLDWIRFSYQQAEQSYEERFEEIRNIALLILDDLGTQNTTPWAQEKLYQIINHRYVKQLPTVITTNQNLNEIDGRISSRLHDPSLVTMIRIIAPDYRDPMTDTSVPPLSSLGLHSKQTFSNFSLRENENLNKDARSSLDHALQTSLKYADAPQGWLVFNGDYATGKTHLAAAIGNYRTGMGESPMFVVVPDLLDHLRATFSPSSNIPYDQLFEQVRSSPLLILDDLGTQSATPWAQEKLYQILNHRYNAELPTVITTSATLDKIDARIRSRMQDQRLCQYLLITVPGYRSGGNSGKPTRRTVKSAPDK